jgi:hypothetical protein
MNSTDLLLHELENAPNKIKNEILNAPIGKDASSIKEELLPYLKLLETNQLGSELAQFTPLVAGRKYLFYQTEINYDRRNTTTNYIITVGYYNPRPLTQEEVLDHMHCGETVVLNDALTLEYTLADYIQIQPSQMNYNYHKTQEKLVDILNFMDFSCSVYEL